MGFQHIQPKSQRIQPQLSGELLLSRIEVVTGKTITREPALFQPGAEVESYDEGPEDWEDEDTLVEVAS